MANILIENLLDKHMLHSQMNISCQLPVSVSPHMLETPFPRVEFYLQSHSATYILPLFPLFLKRAVYCIIRLTKGGFCQGFGKTSTHVKHKPPSLGDCDVSCSFSGGDADSGEAMHVPGRVMWEISVPSS